MDLEIEQFTLKELQEIKDWLEQHGVELNKFKKAELSTIEICKEVGHFNGEVWLADDIQAGQSFHSRLGDGKAWPYIAGMLQWGRVYGKETSFVGCYYMLSKVFVAVDTPHGTFQSSLATMMDISKEEEPGMYLICLFCGESLQWPFRVTGSRAIPVPIAYHDGLDHEDGWWEYHNKCFHILLTVPESGHVILPSQLTGISGLTQVVFKAEWEYGQCCMLFRMGKPTRFVPLGMTEIRVFGSTIKDGF